ncbi:kinase-like domain-containing protein [Rhizophagus diaphanus]|nr:kinase-like domain-containing protein [Rhizophagus diaphanus] [Rhizophagus sp. MUCL 43196]
METKNIVQNSVKFVKSIEPGLCKLCGQKNTHRNWCNSCYAKIFKEQAVNWTSGNHDVDEFILQAQIDAKSYFELIEWIPYENFSNIQYLAKGGYGEVYLAYWDEGVITCWSDEFKDWFRDSGQKVILKSLFDSKNKIKEFLDELKLQVKSFDSAGTLGITPCFGITRNPKDDNFMMVMDYGPGGSLRNYLDKKFKILVWHKKLDILCDIIRGIRSIHRAGLTHRDLHGGNIVMYNNYTRITDFGLSKLVVKESSSKKNKIFGVLPFVAPEVLCGNDYNQPADIYSFGIIMNEMATGIPPFNDIPHNSGLAIQIMDGLRPNINKELTPQLIIDLIKQCWDDVPEKRPTAEILVEILRKMKDESLLCTTELYKQIKVIEKSIELDQKILDVKDCSITYETHSQAIYKSRSLEVNKSSKINSEPTIESSLMDLVVPDDSDDDC